MMGLTLTNGLPLFEFFIMWLVAPPLMSSGCLFFVVCWDGGGLGESSWDEASNETAFFCFLGGASSEDEGGVETGISGEEGRGEGVAAAGLGDMVGMAKMEDRRRMSLLAAIELTGGRVDERTERSWTLRGDQDHASRRRFPTDTGAKEEIEKRGRRGGPRGRGGERGQGSQPRGLSVTHTQRSIRQEMWRRDLLRSEWAGGTGTSDNLR